MLDFRLLGIPVLVQPFHWLILGLLGFSFTRPQGRGDLLELALFMLAGFVSILIHEMGHAVVGRKFGARPEVVLHGMGGVAIFPGAKFSRSESFWTTAAGPGVQLILGALALAILNSGSLPDTQIGVFFGWLFIVSFFWAIFNCVPVWPLDGGQMLGAMLGEKRAALTYQIGMVTASVLAVLGLLWGQIFITIFMGFMAYQNYQMFQQHKNHWR